MQQNKLISILLSFSLVLQAIIFQLALPKAVLCLGEDGHIAIEWQEGQSSCTHDDQIAGLFPAQLPKEIVGHATSGCLDINLHFHNSFATQKGKTLVAPLHSSCIQGIVQFSDKENGVTSFSSTRSIYDIPQIQTVKTTILLI